MARYVPVIRWKRGERYGLRYTASAVKAQVIPVIVVGADQFRGKKPTKSKPALTPATALAQEITTDWGTNPFFLDASHVPNAPQGHHPLVDIANACRLLGAKIIPVTRLNATPQYQQAIQTVVNVDKRGAAIRTDLQGMSSAQQWVQNWPIPLAITDLLVDFSDNVSTVAALGPALDHAFATLYNGSQWRSVTSIGTSMPENFSGYIAGLHAIARRELTLWQHLDSTGLPYQLDYGDYATVPITPPPSEIAWGYPINVKYTLNDQFLICRGVGTTGIGGVDMDQQLIGHAKSIVSYAARNRISSWADDRVDAIASQTEAPSNLEHWVRIGVNRHIELTRANLP